MAHTFDTGATKPQRKIIRDAVVARLAPLRQPTLYLASVKPSPVAFGGALNDEERALLEELLLGKSPAAIVALGRKTYEASGVTTQQDQYKAELEVFVYVVSQKGSSLLARQEGDAISAAANTRDPGIETILEHCEELLIGFQPTDPTSTVYQLRPVDEQELDWGPDYTVWQQSYRVPVRRELLRDKDATETLTSIETKSLLDDVSTPPNPIARPITSISV